MLGFLRFEIFFNTAYSESRNIGTRKSAILYFLIKGIERIMFKRVYAGRTSKKLYKLYEYKK